MRINLPRPAMLVALLLHPGTLAAISALGVAFCYNAENQLESLPFSLAVAGVLFGVLLVITRRAGFSVYVAWLIVVVVAVISAIKFKMNGFSFHYYDFVAILSDPETSKFLLESYLYLILPVAALLLLGIAFGAFVFRHDRVIASPWARVAPVTLAAVLIPLTLPAQTETTRVFYYISGRHVSAFFVSLLDMQHLFVENELEVRLAAMAPETPFPEEVSCENIESAPDVFVVLGETHIDPAIFPQIEGGASILPTYSPRLGETHPMYVEVFGGGTWVTNLSLFTGLSATDFGWRSHYLTTALENKVKGAMPEVFARCGYRTVALLPMAYTFVNEGPFLRSIGFETVLALSDLNAPSYHMRDQFYYQAAEDFIARHRKEDGRPLFMEIQTMYPHSPYNEKLASDELRSPPFEAEGELREYLSRLAVARADLQAFADQRSAEAKGNPSVLLEFGDHQPFITKPLVDELAGDDALGQPRSLAYRTFYSAVGFGREVRPMPDDIDVGFLGASFLEAADLPMSPLTEDLLRLRDTCNGSLHGCADRAAVDRHLRRRVDSGMLNLFEESNAPDAVAFHAPTWAIRH